MKLKLTNTLKAISLVLALSFAGDSAAMTSHADREADQARTEAAHSR